MRSASAKPLEGRVALVAGATRGAGRGIACMLGESGATVYCTGRSTRTSQTPPAQTIEETAELVSEHGGEGIAIVADHTAPEDVTRVTNRIADESGKLDILINDIWGGDALIEWGTPFWKLEVDRLRVLFDRAVYTHVLTTRAVFPLLLRSERGLIVEVTDGDHYGYRGQFYYDLIKTLVIRLAFGMARELQRSTVMALAVTPGFMRSEAVLAHFGVSEENWRDAIEKDPHFVESETPFYVGRAIACLAADSLVGERAGRVFSSWGLAEEYGFTDVDGRTPNWDDHITKTTGRTFANCDDAFYSRYWEDGVVEAIFPEYVQTP